jgi:hypothetical protein
MSRLTLWDLMHQRHKARTVTHAPMAEDRYPTFHYLDDRHSHLRNDRFKPARQRILRHVSKIRIEHCLRFNHRRTATRNMLEISKVYDAKWPCADVDCRERRYNYFVVFYLGTARDLLDCRWPAACCGAMDTAPPLTAHTWGTMPLLPVQKGVDNWLGDRAEGELYRLDPACRK